MTAHERTGWRDKDLSGRHRDWGHDCPMSDLDFIGTEYDNREPVALIDYKLRQNPYEPLPRTVRLLKDDSNLWVLGRLGALAQIPSFVVFYGRQFAWFQVQGLNKIGVNKTPEAQPMSEKDYVRFLYELRGRKLPEEIEGNLVDETVAYIQEHYNEETSVFDDWPKV